MPQPQFERAPPDRLTQGLVRDELRQYRYAMTRPKTSFTLLFEFLEKRCPPVLQNGRFTEAQRKTLRRDLDRLIRDRFRPYGFQVTRQPLAGIDSKTIEVHGYDYTVPRTYRLHRLGEVPEGSQAVFEEESIEFRHLRFAISARRVIVDDFSSNIGVSFHALMRIVARCNTNHPISYLRENAPYFLPFVTLALTGSIVLGESRQVAIPLVDGMIVGDVAIIEGEEMLMLQQRRLLFEQSAYGLATPPIESLFSAPGRKRESFVSIRGTTFIDNDNIGVSKAWARQSLIDLVDKYPGARRILHDMLVSPETSSHDGAKWKFLIGLYREYAELTDTPRWKAALRE